MPCIDRIMELDTWIGTRPCRMANIIPQIPRFDRFGNAAVGAIGQVPICILFNRLEECICHADRVVGILPRN